MATTFPYEAKVYDIFQPKYFARDKEQLKFSHHYKLGLRHMRYAYERLYLELVRYAETGYKEYLQVVWKRKLFQLCEILLIDEPSWLPRAVLGQLRHIRSILSDPAPILPHLTQEDRSMLHELVGAVLTNWDSYIESVYPSNEQEIILCMTFESTTMKNNYQDWLSQLGMTSFFKTPDGSFHVIGNATPEEFNAAFRKLLWKVYRIQPNSLHSIVRYSVGSQSSLTSFDI